MKALFSFLVTRAKKGESWSQAFLAETGHKNRDVS